MGLTKEYLAYENIGKFNIIASRKPNIVFITHDKIDGRFVAVGAAENVIIWDLRLAQSAVIFERDGKTEVTTICASPDKLHIAVGYADGTIGIFNLITKKSVCSIPVHRSAINVLRYDRNGMKLVSGGQDTEIIIIDIVSQIGTIRLSGHTGPITDICFYEKNDNILISSSKDTQIKFWNLDTAFAFKTLIDHRTDIWGIGLFRDGDLLITGCTDSSLNVFKISPNDPMAMNENDGTSSVVIADTDEQIFCPIKCNLIGQIQRIGRGRTCALIGDPTGRILGVHGTDNQIELFYICNKDEIAKRLTKRLKKLSITTKPGEGMITLSDEIRRLPSIKCDSKLKSIDLLIGIKNELRIAATFIDNIIRLYSFNFIEKNAEANLLKSLTLCGHHSEIRCVCFSSDSEVIASASADSLKLWNRQSVQNIRTIEHNNYVLCMSFAPGNQYILLGLKSGKLLIVDLNSANIIEEIPAHTDELWAIDVLPDSSGCVTGGGDKTIKLWTFHLIHENSTVDHTDFDTDRKPTILSLLHRNTLKLEETVLCLKISANNKFIAIGLLDSTVRIFFLDSLKFYLSLYGHKLPILCLDITDDAKLIATGSGDRNVKLWGMDFGDCHRSIFAHDDSVKSVKFIPGTHLFWTCGKDGKIKQWDGDTFNKIIQLNGGHIGEAYQLTVSPCGYYMVTCGSDRVLRLFKRTNQLLVLQDLQEEEREEMENQQLATGDESGLPGLPGLKLPSRKTVGAEKAAEQILECLEICEQYETMDDVKSKLPQLMMAYNVTNTIDFIMKIFMNIRSSDLEESLVLIPFSCVCKILEKIPQILHKCKDQIELIVKIVIFLFRIHHKQLVSNQTLMPIIQTIINRMDRQINDVRDLIGTNLYTLQLIQRDIEARENIELFADAAHTKKLKDRKQKQRQLTKRLNIQMS